MNVSEISSSDQPILVLDDFYVGQQRAESLADLAGAIGNVSLPHYSDSDELYNHEIASRLRQADQLFAESTPVVNGVELRGLETAREVCQDVQIEYQETVERRLRQTYHSDAIEIPIPDAELVWLAYLDLRMGQAVMLPTSVGNIVAAASEYSLDTMFAVKERPREKAGVVLTTIDTIEQMAEIELPWLEYLRFMHQEGVLVGAKLPRKPDSRFFHRQSTGFHEASMFADGTSMFVSLPGPYSDAVARLLGADGMILAASSANKSGEGNNREIDLLHPDIRRGSGFVVRDAKAVDAYPLDRERESQGVMIDFLPDKHGQPKFLVSRSGFLQGAFLLLTRQYLHEHPELGIDYILVDVENRTQDANPKAE